MNWVIWDLDNCLANDGWRLKFIDFSTSDMDQRYAAYHAAAPEDQANSTAAGLFRWLHSAHTTFVPVFISARPESCRAATWSWLQKWLGIRDTPGAALWLRPEGQHLGTVETKEDLLERFMRLRHIDAPAIVMAFDDRADIVEMYRSKGIPAFQLAAHSECAYAPPPPAPIEELAMPRRERVTDDTKDAQTDVPALLRAAASTFEGRNATYGSAYRKFGPLLRTLLGGKDLSELDDDGWTRIGLLMMLAGKLQRYAENVTRGGHQDSAHDAAVYSAMLEEMTGK